MPKVFQTLVVSTEGVSSTMIKVKLAKDIYLQSKCEKFLIYDVKNLLPFDWGKFNKFFLQTCNLHSGQSINYMSGNFM